MSEIKTTRNYRELLQRYGARFAVIDLNTFDPVSEITIILQECGHPEPGRWVLHLDGRARDLSFDINVRRILINRYWRTVLGMLDTDTSNDRYALSDQGEIKHWITSVAATVIPLAVEHNLP